MKSSFAFNGLCCYCCCYSGWCTPFVFVVAAVLPTFEWSKYNVLLLLNEQLRNRNDLRMHFICNIKYERLCNSTITERENIHKCTIFLYTIYFVWLCGKNILWKRRREEKRKKKYCCSNYDFINVAVSFNALQTMFKLYWLMSMAHECNAAFNKPTNYANQIMDNWFDGAYFTYTFVYGILLVHLLFVYIQ